MKENHFTYKGMKYKSGTILKIKPTVGRANPSPKMFEEATFMFYNTDSEKYFIQVGGTTYLLREQGFFDILIYPMDRINNNYLAAVAEEERWSFGKELAIDNMPVAWIWYIFLMGLTFIFNGRIFYWIFISIIFFAYRNKKLREEGYR
jgi:hypothetical protein